MNKEPSPLGVAADAPAPAPTWPAPAQLAPAKESPSVTLPPAWPRAAQWATAFLLLLAVGLLAWHFIGSQCWGARPTTLQADAVSTSRLDLNKADHAQLLQLPGVGDTLARRIEAYRQEHHGFRNVEELRKVGGIGPAILERLRPLVYVDLEESGQEDEPPPVPIPREIRLAADMPVVLKKGAELAGLIDLNRATAEELQHLPGIGPKMSARIIETRKQGPFKSVDELRRVPGIGVKTLAKLRPLVTVEAAVAKAPEK
jgi:competence ComEA-like helix-hairpin-helix protein